MSQERRTVFAVGCSFTSSMIIFPIFWAVSIKTFEKIPNFFIISSSLLMVVTIRWNSSFQLGGGVCCGTTAGVVAEKI